jgi:ABC-type multidrug transport system fused ATPase/permease subunit
LRNPFIQISQNKNIKRLQQLLSKREKRLILFIILIQVALGLLDLAGVMMIGLLTAVSVAGIGAGSLGERTSYALSILNLDGRTLQSQAIVLGLIAAFFLTSKTLISLFFTRKSLFFLSRRSATISADLIMRLLNQSLLKVQEKSRQQTIYSLTNGVNILTVNIIGSAVNLISDISLLLILSIGLFLIDTTIAVSALVLYGLVGYLLYYLMQVKVKSLGKEQSLLLIESNEKMYEVLTSYRELVVRNRRHYYANIIGNIRHNLANAVAQSAFLVNISKYVIELTVVIGGLLITGIQFAINSAAYSVALISIFLAASTRIAPAVLRIQQGLLSIKSNIGVAEPTLNMIENLAGEVKVTKASNYVDVEHKGFTGIAEIKDAYFKYPNQIDYAVADINLTIDPGTVVALVGPSGAGKTTLIDLLIGVLEPDSGYIKISDVSPEIAITNWTGAISYVPQDIVITNGSIRENILLGYPSSPENDDLVVAALKSAHLDKFIQGLPTGIDFEVGDRGAKLSGGQRQRLGIARALFTKPLLLILDEATSSLDAESEANISESISQLKDRTTVVLIAHRLSTVKNADKVIYMENGRIRATGNFDQVRAEVPNFDKQAKLMGL